MSRNSGHMYIYYGEEYINKLEVDFMGYEVSEENFITCHHIYLNKEVDNGDVDGSRTNYSVPLGRLSHDLLHGVIELYNPNLYIKWRDYFLKVYLNKNMTSTLSKERLLLKTEIEMWLNQYCKLKLPSITTYNSKYIKRLLKDDYIKDCIRYGNKILDGYKYASYTTYFKTEKEIVEYDKICSATFKYLIETDYFNTHQKKFVESFSPYLSYYLFKNHNIVNLHNAVDNYLVRKK